MPPRERGRYAGYIGATFALATVSGPLVGGVIVDAPGMRERLGQQGFDPIVDTPAGFDAYLRSEQAKWARVVKTSGAKAE